MKMIKILFGLSAVSAQHWSYGWHPGKSGLLTKR